MKMKKIVAAALSAAVISVAQTGLPVFADVSANGIAQIAEGYEVRSVFSFDQLHTSDQSAAYDRIMAMQASYPEGTPWSNNDSHVWCDIYYSEGSSTACSGYVGYGCVGFAMILSDAAFGNAPAREIRQVNYDAIRVGDIVRVNGDTHSVIILTKDADSVTVAEGNYNRSVHWGRRISRSAIEAASYYVTRYDDTGAAETASNTPDAAGIETFVRSLYSDCLGRDPDPAGLQDWCSRLASGQITGKQCALGFFFSPEFLNKAPQLSDAELVDIYYRVFLNRSADPAGQSYWMSMIANTTDDISILFTGFADSAEFAGKCSSYGIAAGAHVDTPSAVRLTPADYISETTDRV